MGKKSGLAAVLLLAACCVIGAAGSSVGTAAAGARDLATAVNEGGVQVTVGRSSRCPPHSVLAVVTNRSEAPISLLVTPGTTLRSRGGRQPELAVHRVTAATTVDGEWSSAGEIVLDGLEMRGFCLAAYSLDPSNHVDHTIASFQLGPVDVRAQTILEAAQRADLSSAATQATLWMALTGVGAVDVDRRLHMSRAELEAASEVAASCGAQVGWETPAVSSSRMGSAAVPHGDAATRSTGAGGGVPTPAATSLAPPDMPWTAASESSVADAAIALPGITEDAARHISPVAVSSLPSPSSAVGSPVGGLSPVEPPMAVAIGGVGGGLVLRPKVRSVREFRQEDVTIQRLDHSCGSAAIATVMTSYLGDPVTEPEVIEQLLKSGDLRAIVERRGFSLLDLKHFLESRGAKAEGYAMDFEALVGTEPPVIVPIRPADQLHFVVYRGASGGRVFLADPAFGRRAMPVREFERLWSPQVGLVVSKLGVDVASSPLALQKRDEVFPDRLSFDLLSLSQTLAYIWRWDEF